MQYLLTEEEYRELNKPPYLGLTKKRLQTLCTKIADTMPVNAGWRREENVPWGCILSKIEDDDEWFCDECPHERKHYSK